SPLGDNIVNNSTFCSSWIDFDPPIEFKRDQNISITLDRSGPNPTRRIYVRLMPANSSPDSDNIGISTLDITGTVVNIKLLRDYKNIKQLSIHGGTNPFGGGKHPLPSNAGTSCPIIISADTNP